jgi:hypothetical protein
MTNKVALDALCADILAHGVPSATLGAYADEIRQECADRAVKWYNEPDNQNYLEKYDDDEYWNNALTAAIIGKEAGK